MKISNEYCDTLKNILAFLPRETLVNALIRSIETIQSDGCSGCVYEIRAEWEKPCLACKRSTIHGNVTKKGEPES